MAKKSIIVFAFVVVLGFVLVAKIPNRQNTQGFDDLMREFPEITECSEVKGPYLEEDCIRQKSVELNDTRLCSLIQTALGKSECLRAFALANSDLGFCRLIEDQTYRDGCVYSVAVDRRNSSMCHSIESNASRTRCLAKTMVDPESCSEIENQVGRDWCMKKLSIETYTVDLCSRVVTASIKDACYFEYVQKNSIAAANCKKIVDEELRQKCWGEATILSCQIKDFMPKYGKPL